MSKTSWLSALSTSTQNPGCTNDTIPWLLCICTHSSRVSRSRRVAETRAGAGGESSSRGASRRTGGQELRTGGCIWPDCGQPRTPASYPRSAGPQGAPRDVQRRLVVLPHSVFCSSTPSHYPIIVHKPDLFCNSRNAMFTVYTYTTLFSEI